jgi:hypothetical protein
VDVVAHLLDPKIVAGYNEFSLIILDASGKGAGFDHG